MILTQEPKRDGGQCEYVGNGYIIEINHLLLRDDTDIDGLKNTIIHELLHTCKGCMKHTGEWKRLAEKVNRYYGYNIKRCGNADDKGISEEQKERIVKEKSNREIKHKYRCSGCGQEINRYRDSKFTKQTYLYRCGICGGEFEKIF